MSQDKKEAKNKETCYIVRPYNRCLIMRIVIGSAKEVIDKYEFGNTVIVTSILGMTVWRVDNGIPITIRAGMVF